MRETDFQEFKGLLTDVMAYYRQDVSKFMLDMWWMACEPFDLEQIQRAMQRHATDPERGQFAPKVADLVRILHGTATDRAALAWGKTLEAMQTVGAYTDVVFDDPAIHAVVEDLGGWPKLCRCDLKELSYMQHRFSESHRAYTGRGTFDYPRRLVGDRSPDAMYTKRGLPLPHPALIGEPQRCALVYQGGTNGGKTAITFQSVEQLAHRQIAEALP
ncbi:MAG: hypothetical protein I8H71_01285 [Xanthomonadaceae bacterium]|nr:hypothetical protein [Xanthomonadaceae bacterium]